MGVQASKEKAFEDIRFFALWDRETKAYIFTPKGKCLWDSRSAVKTAVYAHTGQYWKDVRSRFEIRQFELKEVKKKNTFFAELYRKNMGEF